MSDYATPPRYHKKTKRSRPRRCCWCDEMIVAGEVYATWFSYDGGERSSVYAHSECSVAWGTATDKHWDTMYEADGDHKRGSEEPKEGW